MRMTAILLAAATLAACSYTPAERQATVPPGSTAAAGPGIDTNGRSDATGTVNVIGTPFYALFKATGCVATAVIAGPTAAVIALADRPDKAQMRRRLDHGVATNCGGSYVLRG